MKASLQNALLLEYITLAWNVAGSIIIIMASMQASSISLLGFGIDSMIEIFASLIVICQLKSINKNKEAIATRLLDVAFLLLGVYLVIQSMIAMLHHNKSHASNTGIVWLAFTAIAMFLLAYAKKKTGKAISNTIVIKEANVTVIDGLLAVSVLIGLLLSKYFGLQWADVAACFILAVYAFKEGMQAF